MCIRDSYNAIGKYQPLVPKEGARVSGFHLQTHGDLAGYAAYLKTVNTEKVEAAANDHRLLDMILTICQSPLFKGTAG